MTDAERIEAGARVICGKMWSPLDFATVSEMSREMYRNLVLDILRAGYPELHAEPPTHWLAPIEPTGDIARAIRKVFMDEVPAPGHHAWEAARTAHLAQGKGTGE